MPLSGPFTVTRERDRSSGFPWFSTPPASPASGRCDTLAQMERLTADTVPAAVPGPWLGLPAEGGDGAPRWAVEL